MQERRGQATIVGNFHLTAGRAFPALQMDNRQFGAHSGNSLRTSCNESHRRQW
jgi:hypothetical protein